MDGNDSVDPKQDTSDMAAFLSLLFDYMLQQSRFQTMSDSIITKNILFHRILLSTCKHLLDLLDFNALDEMGNRIDELEKSINELKEEIGGENSPSPSVPPAPKDDSKSPGGS
ncbi:hypothetical protein GQ457_13G026770 [Hibiscus cannabinus]